MTDSRVAAAVQEHLREQDTKRQMNLVAQRAAQEDKEAHELRQQQLRLLYSKHNPRPLHALQNTVLATHLKPSICDAATRSASMKRAAHTLGVSRREVEEFVEFSSGIGIKQLERITVRAQEGEKAIVVAWCEPYNPQSQEFQTVAWDSESAYNPHAAAKVRDIVLRMMLLERLEFSSNGLFQPVPLNAVIGYTRADALPVARKRNLLLELPAEMRNLIYEFVLYVSHNKDDVVDLRPRRGKSVLDILLTCRMINKEAAPSFYNVNHVRINFPRLRRHIYLLSGAIGTVPTVNDTAITFINTIGRVRRAGIGKLTMRTLLDDSSALALVKLLPNLPQLNSLVIILNNLPGDAALPSQAELAECVLRFPKLENLAFVDQIPRPLRRVRMLDPPVVPLTPPGYVLKLNRMVAKVMEEKSEVQREQRR